MNCHEIAEGYEYAKQLISVQEKSKTRLFIIICLLSLALLLESFYIIYDRKCDSEFSSVTTETTTTIEQDSDGYNSYIGGDGDVYIGSENQKDN